MEPDRIILRPVLPPLTNLIVAAKSLLMPRLGLFLGLALIPQLYWQVVVLTGNDPFTENLNKPDWLLLLYLVQMVLSWFFTVALITAITNSGIRSIAQALNVSRNYFVNFVVAEIFFEVMILFGLIFLLGPGIYLFVIFYFFPFSLVLENRRIWASLKRSQELTKGYRWAIFGRLVFMLVILGLGFGLAWGLSALLNNRYVYEVLFMIFLAGFQPFRIAFDYQLYLTLVRIKG